MLRIPFLFLLLSFFSVGSINANETQDYEQYHLQTLSAEKLITTEAYHQALVVYERLFEQYDFVFLREYQIATQLALITNNKKKAKAYLKQGILAGWHLKSIKKNKFLTPLWENSSWKSFKNDYKTLRKQYEATLNQKVRAHVKGMFVKDQKKAFKALFRFSSKGQDKYAEQKFAPHSEKQIAEFRNILANDGYPGAQLIGNNFWMSTILSHHNSISTAYANKDKLYPRLQPLLKEALKKGQISPPELATIEDWYLSTKTERKAPTYGILAPPSPANLLATNKLRKSIFLRPLALRDALVLMQKKTGMNFYLPGRWY